LLQVERHCDLLDAFGGAIQLREQYQKLYTAFQDRAGELKALVAKNKEREQQRELLGFQNKEITDAHLVPGEEEELLQEKRILANAGMLYEKAFGVYAQLYEDEHACLSVLKQLLKELQEAGGIDEQIVPFKNSLESALLQLEDTAFSLRNYAKRITVDPGRLEALEARLDELYRLKKKYGSTIEQILAYHQSMQQELEVLEGSSARIDELKSELAEYGKNLWSLAEELSEKREKAARQLKKK
ncbi:MAG: DNA repair protein RecN, partial [Pseudomonadota bacterium]